MIMCYNFFVGQVYHNLCVHDVVNLYKILEIFFAYGIIILLSGVAQPAERVAVNHQVGGSSPSPRV